MTPYHPCTFTDDELVRLPSLSIPPIDPDPFYWLAPNGTCWVVGRHMGNFWVRGPALADDPLVDGE